MDEANQGKGRIPSWLIEGQVETINLEYKEHIYRIAFNKITMGQFSYPWKTHLSKNNLRNYEYY